MVLVLVLGALALATGAGAQHSDPKLDAGEGNSPPGGAAAGGPFTAIVPCRIVDTRRSGAPAQVGPLAPGATIAYDVLGTEGQPYFTDQGARGCTIPATATAVQLTFTSVDATGRGHLRAFPANADAGTTGATVLNYDASGLNPTNSVLLGVGHGEVNGTTGELVVRHRSPDASTTHLVIDVTGFVC